MLNWRKALILVFLLVDSMSPMPSHRPQQLSLGPLEAEILEILWRIGTATVKDIHEQILTDPDRELAYASVTTVLNRLQKKGWVKSDRSQRHHYWQPRVSQEEACVLQAHNRLQQFLAIGNPDVVAAFADSLDTASVEQLDAIAQRLKAARQAREND